MNDLVTPLSILLAALVLLGGRLASLDDLSKNGNVRSALVVWERILLLGSSVVVVLAMFILVWHADWNMVGVMVCLAGLLYLASVSVDARLRTRIREHQQRRTAFRRLSAVQLSGQVENALRHCATALASGEALLASDHARFALQEWARDKGVLPPDRTIAALVDECPADLPAEFARAWERLLSMFPPEKLIQICTNGLDSSLTTSEHHRFVRTVWSILVDADVWPPEFGDQLEEPPTEAPRG